jgi:hypothetical protein
MLQHWVLLSPFEFYIRSSSEGMGNASGQLGHNLMDHHFRCGAEGSAEGFEDKYTYGRRANGIYIPRYQNIGNDKEII